MLHFHELKLNQRDPVYAQICLHVKRQILLKRIESGDKLPSRREIATQLNINPNTVQKAFKLMEDEGFVRTTSTAGSELYVTQEIYDQIETELTRELVRQFVDDAKESRMSFKKVVELVSELWEVDE